MRGRDLICKFHVWSLLHSPTMISTSASTVTTRGTSDHDIGPKIWPMLKIHHPP
ncbi:hypothetical protein RchiOBHm_Chr2g0161891 [Rosa chinensis]|uniref:Uncharacterized protein n=1 Tax=Rosa chinensis TaxID=74649 RepID=A0A2P6S2X5_ROSCH|nr:hypothetical protein RchiOBHm_Chr2g0161891 [Rosa chinensis]